MVYDSGDWSREARATVPELTGTADIKLNERVSLRRRQVALGMHTRTIAPVRGLPQAKPSGDHIPLGGFVLQKSDHVSNATVERDSKI